MLSFAAELGRIAAALAAQGIPFLTFKGPALSLALYGDLAAREYGDLDILVPEAFMARAEEVLAGFGYRSPYGDRPFRLAFQAHLRQFPLERPDGEGWLDLHWEFVGSFLPFPLRSEDVWGRLGEVTIGGQRVPTLAGEDLALLLAGHGTKEAWRYLAWVLDFAMLIDRQPEIDWTEVHRRAHARGCGDAVLLGCMLCRDLFDVAVPDVLAREVASNVRVARLASRIVARLRQGTPPSAKVENFADFDLCDRAMDRLVARLRLTLTPTVSDHHAWPLPRPFWRLYYLTRPFRLAAKAVATRFS